MSYMTISQSREDQALIARVTAAIAQEGRNDAEYLVTQIIWTVCARSDIEAAYASTLAGGNPNPGADESAITDGMILAAVQAELAELPEPLSTPDEGASQ